MCVCVSVCVCVPVCACCCRDSVRPAVCHCCSTATVTKAATIIKVLFAEMYVNVVFVVIRCLNSAVSLTVVSSGG